MDYEGMILALDDARYSGMDGVLFPSDDDCRRCGGEGGTARDLELDRPCPHCGGSGMAHEEYK